MFAAWLLLQSALPAPAWVRPPVPLAPPLAETSGLARGVAHPGAIWTLNDSDNPAELFAIDTAGRTLGRVRVRGASNVDWEAIASGPCPGRERGRTCLYVGDIGDNARRRPFLTVYRIPEPDPARDTVVTVLDSLRFQYPDSARDAESMAVDRSGDLWIVSKELVREPRLYRVPARAWRSALVARAEFLGTLPIPSARGIEQWTTDATWSANGGALMVRTYGALWRVPFVAGRPRVAETTLLCGLAGLGPQGEGLVAIGPDVYAISSERWLGNEPSVAVVRCGA